MLHELRYITCEHIERAECGSPKNMAEVHATFTLPNYHILAVCSICSSIILGEAIREMIKGAIKSSRLKGI